MTDRPRHFLAVSDLSASEIAELFRAAARLKRNRRGHALDRPPRRPARPLARGPWCGIRQPQPLAGKVLGLLFHKPSVRTRVSFEVGMAQLGGRSLYIGPVELQGGQRECPRDVARVLSRYLDGIVARTFHHRDLEEMAEEATVPVINGLSDFTHPCQALTDLFTIQEALGRIKGVRLAFVGDGNNVCHALMEAAAVTGVHLRIATPPLYRPDAASFQRARSLARRSGGSVEWVKDPRETVRGAQVVYTDVWTSMGQEKERSERIRHFRGYRVDRRLMRCAASGALFMHCLPAHRGEEVSDEVIDSDRSIVYDQAENRLHLQKAILLKLMAPRGENP